MKTVIVGVLLIFTSCHIYAQEWAKKGNTFVYTGYVVALPRENNKAETLKTINNFKVTVDSVVRVNGAKFIFLTNYFDAIHAGLQDNSNVQEKVCLAIYKDTLYTVSFIDNTRLTKALNIKDIFSNKIGSIYVDKQYSVLKYNPKKKTRRYVEELAPDEKEPEYSFNSMVRFKGKFPGEAANLIAEDGRGSYSTNIYYSNSLFIRKYHSIIYRTGIPYKLDLSLVNVIHQ